MLQIQLTKEQEPLVELLMLEEEAQLTISDIADEITSLCKGIVERNVNELCLTYTFTTTEDICVCIADYLDDSDVYVQGIIRATVDIDYCDEQPLQSQCSVHDVYFECDALDAREDEDVAVKKLLRFITEQRIERLVNFKLEKEQF